MSSEKEKFSWFSEITDSIKNITKKLNDFFLDIINKAESTINHILWYEIFKITEQTDKELQELQDDLLDLNNDELWNKEISEKERKILEKLISNEKIKIYFEWLKNNDDNSIDDETFNKEQKILLKFLKQKTDDNNDKKWDLTKNEIDNIASLFESKYNILDSVMKDDRIKDKEPKPTKKEILDIYNELNENNNDVKVDEIIEIINKK